ncbi:hypothetical protein SCUCBS95973_003667 [Sporothrix curviconia]|uniref:Phenol 2-monooxygenase n=1 Tax=Sporothrix curviconia TaxID=1260050 RepID=A0ABP0BIA9_9PEZI
MTIKGLPMEEQVDVLICGSGSAGLCAAMWLARCGIKYKIVERRPGPLTNGQADGVQCRTVEIFESFGIAEDMLKEAYHVLELAFWTSAGSDGKGIHRTNYAPDLEKGLSHQPHVILNQARVNGLMLEDIQRRTGTVEMLYGAEVQTVEVDESRSSDHDARCVTTRVVMADGQSERVFRSKYVLACDGAHSAVRRSLGYKMLGDSTDAVWGVMDVYVQTDFPDIRKKAVLQSAEHGNLIIIPREGGALVRLYIELGSDAAVAAVTQQTLAEHAARIFYPYSLAVVGTVWWSAYKIGQRLADRFSSTDNRVFLTGDACHTHSPKAGQGMNVSLQDGYNIGWKLAGVLNKTMPASVLDTYVSERRQTAHDLIEFDRYFAKLFSSTYRHDNGITAEMFAQKFVEAGRYTAGQAIKYGASVLVAASPAADEQALATNITVGMRFPSAQVVRVGDAKAMQLVRALPCHAQWHLLVFAGDILRDSAARRLAKTAAELHAIIQHVTPDGADADSVIQAVLVFQSKRQSVEQEQIPPVFTPTTGKWRIKNLDKSFADDESYNSGHGHAYELYGINPEQGCMVLVRPDHYVSMVTALENTSKIRDFFQNILLPVR